MPLRKNKPAQVSGKTAISAVALDFLRANETSFVDVGDSDETSAGNQEGFPVFRGIYSVTVLPADMGR